MKRINTLHSCCRERIELREEEKDDINSLFKEKMENQKNLTLKITAFPPSQLCH